MIQCFKVHSFKSDPSRRLRLRGSTAPRYCRDGASDRQNLPSLFVFDLRRSLELLHDEQT